MPKLTTIDTIESAISDFAIRPREGANLSMVRLLHVVSGEGTNDIGAWEIENLANIRIATIAEEVWEKAKSDANGWGSDVQTYVLSADFGGSLEGVRSRPFRIRGEDALSSDETDTSEPPTEKGLVTKLMRHLEKKDNALMTMFTTATKTLERRLDRAEQRSEQLEDRFVDSIETVAKLATDSHQKKLELLKEASAQKRYNEGFDMFKSLVAPATVQTVMAKLGVPLGLAGPSVVDEDGKPKVDPMIETIIGVVDSLEETQLTALVNVLKPQQAQAFLALYESVNQIRAQRDAESEKAKRLAKEAKEFGEEIEEQVKQLEE